MPISASPHPTYLAEQHTIGATDGGRRERLVPEGRGVDPATDPEPDGGGGRVAAQAAREQSVTSSGEFTHTDGDLLLLVSTE